MKNPDGFLYTLTFCAALITAGLTSAYASDGDVTFNGKIIDSACTVSGVNGSGNTNGTIVTLPDVTTGAFDATSKMAGMTPFTINLTGCNVTTMHNATVNFSGTADTTDTTILKNTKATNGVGVAILEDDGVTMVNINTGTYSRPQTLATGTNALKFKTAYKANSTVAAVTSGDVQSYAVFDVSYQ